jgi:hypothetical protein
MQTIIFQDILDSHFGPGSICLFACSTHCFGGAKREVTSCLVKLAFVCKATRTRMICFPPSSGTGAPSLFSIKGMNDNAWEKHTMHAITTLHCFTILRWKFQRLEKPLKNLVINVSLEKAKGNHLIFPRIKAS